MEKVISRKIPQKKKITYPLYTGAVAGLINGLFGGGGGMIVVPMLIRLIGVSPKKAHATAVFIILPLSVVSGILYAGFGNFEFKTGLPVTIGVLIGGVIGAVLLKKFTARTVTLIFAVVMAVAGAKMLFF